METKEQLLKNLGFSDELIASVSSGDKIVFQQRQDFDCVESEDFSEIIIDEVETIFTSELII